MIHRLEIPRSYWRPGQPEYKKVTVNLKKWGDKCRRAVLNSIAKNWGQINWQKTIISNGSMTAINYGCSSHGGVVLFSLHKLENWEPEWSCENFSGEFPMDWYVYVFEEDCEWAVLWQSLSDSAKLKMVNKPDDVGKWEEMAINIVKHCHPNQLPISKAKL